MAKVNEAFERLREVMPDLNLILQDEKDTKVGYKKDTKVGYKKDTKVGYEKDTKVGYEKDT